MLAMSSSSPDPKKASTFLKSLSQNPTTMAQFAQNPTATMQQAGLHPTQISAINSGSVSQIRGVLPQAADDGPNIVVVIVLASMKTTV